MSSVIERLSYFLKKCLGASIPFMGLFLPGQSPVSFALLPTGHHWHVTLPPAGHSGTAGPVLRPPGGCPPCPHGPGPAASHVAGASFPHQHLVQFSQWPFGGTGRPVFGAHSKQGPCRGPVQDGLTVGPCGLSADASILSVHFVYSFTIITTQ